MATLTPQFSADRAVREYTEKQYMPASESYLERIANNGENAKKLTEKMHNLNEKWGSMHFGDVEVEQVNAKYNYKVPVYFNDLDPDMIQIELYAEGLNGQVSIRAKDD